LDQTLHATTTTLTSNVTQGYVGEMITLTAKVKTVAATPPGSVQFYIDNVAYGSPVTLNGNGVSTLSLNTLTAGTHAVVAAYLTAVPLIFADSQSAPLDITIAAAATASLQPDPIVVSESNLVIRGSTGQETIAVYPGGTNQTVVKILGATPYQGVFTTSQISHLIVNGGTGNNTLWIEPGVKIPAILLGGNGNNTLMGGPGPAILVGGSGQNTLRAGTGPTIMIAGSGVAHLYGSSGYDLLIGGTTTFDGDSVALERILMEWGNLSSGFHARVSHLLGPNGGLNGTDFLNSTTVQAGSNLDTLSGGSSYTWFLVSQAQQTDGCVFNDLPQDVVTYVS
jgi:Ca2+-binding RTX toxin-like protein